MKRTEQVYLCTRPRLAAQLIDNGIPVRETRNPFATDAQHSKAWEISINRASATIIRDFFQAIGKPVPIGISMYFSEVDQWTI